MIIEIISADYPTSNEIYKIRHWPIDDFAGLMDYIEPYWSRHGSFLHRGNIYRLATGGWSGNEDIIGAMKSNNILWLLYWYLSKVGGLYLFRERKLR
jgi:hypothetical protein